jgi:hypothetical protein
MIATLLGSYKIYIYCLNQPIEPFLIYYKTSISKLIYQNGNEPLFLNEPDNLSEWSIGVGLQQVKFNNHLGGKFKSTLIFSR